MLGTSGWGIEGALTLGARKNLHPSAKKRISSRKLLNSPGTCKMCFRHISMFLCLILGVLGSASLTLDSRSIISSDEFEVEHVGGYQLTREETDAYWASHRASTSFDSSDSLSKGSTPSTLHQKRSIWSGEKCTLHNRYRLAGPDIILDTLYRLRYARCIYPFFNPLYVNVCDATHRTLEGYLVWWSPISFYSYCPRNYVCVPSYRYEHDIHYGLGWKWDIECVPVMVMPLPVFIRPDLYHGMVVCSPDVVMPYQSANPGKARTQIPRNGLTYLMSEVLEISGGGEYNATRMFIEDISNKMIKSLHRGEMMITNQTASETVIYPGSTRTVKFCAEVPKGRTKWLALHYGAFEIKSRHSR